MTQKVVHHKIKDIAVEMAAVFYEECAHDNKFYKYYPNQKKFVAREWKQFISAAKGSLVKMLGMKEYSDELKEEAYEILMLDYSLPKDKGAKVVGRTGLLH